MVVLAAGPVLASGSDACCATGQVTKAKNEKSCVSLATLKLNADQKSKLEAWQADCMKAGCTQESRTKFLGQAKTILSSEQYAMLKKQCDASAHGKTS